MRVVPGQRAPDQEYHQATRHLHWVLAPDLAVGRRLQGVRGDPK